MDKKEIDDVFDALQNPMEQIVKDIDLLFSENGIIKRHKQDYSPRESQIEASKKIMETLVQRGHAILEGPCGFGKTFAYLVPVFMDIIHSAGRPRTIIVTSGISLQEQLFYKDIPFIEKLFYEMYSKHVNFAMLKGKGNFICKNKMSDLFMTREFSGSATSKILQMYSNDQIKDGDISNLDFVPDYATSTDVSCISEGECLGSSCGFYDECYYQHAKEKAAASQIVVTNYHMLFSDLKTEGKILGEYDNLIFDEAHEIPNIYRDFLEEKISLGTITYIKNKIVEAGNKDKKIKETIISGINFDWVLSTSEEFFSKVKRSLFINPEKDDIKILDSTMPLCLYPKEQKNFITMLDYLNSSATRIVDYCDDQIEALKETYDESAMPAEEVEECNRYIGIYNKFTVLLEKIISTKTLIEDYKNIVSDDHCVYWVENKEGKISIKTKPISVAEELYNNFFDKSDLSCIITSATLSVNGNFEYIKDQLGLNLLTKDSNKKFTEFIGKSPFDLKKQELWYLPENSVDGDSRNSKTFRELLPKQITEILKATNGGALCLFTSYSNLNYAHSAVRVSLPGMKIFKQGDLPRNNLLEAFKNNKDSVLFATRSFFTGVDIPGDSLRCLIIDKFPFPSPGEPVMMKIQKILGSKTFNKVYIPEMVITLKQAVGRGVRTVDDKCVIVVLDGRMSPARYKGQIFNSFPYEKTGTRDIKEVEKFLIK